MLSNKPNDEAIVLAKRTEHDELISRIVMNLTGVEIEKTDNGNLIMRAGNNATMNLKGAKHIYHSLRFNINAVTSLAFLSKENVANMTKDAAITFDKDLIKNYKDWDIKKESLQALMVGFRNIVFSQFTKAEEGKENQAVSEQRVTNKYDINDERKKSGFNPLGGGSQ